MLTERRSYKALPSLNRSSNRRGDKEGGEGGDGGKERRQMSADERKIPQRKKQKFGEIMLAAL